VPEVTTSVPDNRSHGQEVYIYIKYPQLLYSSTKKKMTDRHIFNDHTTLVLRSLKGLVATHPYLSLIPSLKVVYRADHDRSKVSLICGGGSGHEPGTVGFVGKGLLNASVAGDVFASPSARQVGGAIERVGSDKGVILIITNCESEFGRAKRDRRRRRHWSRGARPE
jgi:dihydroxyacetone kinase